MTASEPPKPIAPAHPLQRIVPIPTADIVYTHEILQHPAVDHPRHNASYRLWHPRACVAMPSPPDNDDEAYQIEKNEYYRDHEGRDRWRDT